MIGKLDLYRIFAEVARCRSFSGAAKALFMTQPAVSLAVMNLEKELGTRLFIRTPKGVSLTNEGKLLYEYISSAMNLVRMGEAKVAESCGLESGELKIGVGDTVSKYFLLPHLEEFHRNYPNIKLRVINRTTPELCAMVKAGEVDLAICNLPIRDPSLSVRVCGTIHDIFVCGEKYREACRGIRRLEQIVELPLILLETKSNSRQYVERFMLSRGIKLQPEIELGSHDLLLEFARFNFGIACVIEEFSQDYLQNGLLWKIELEETIPERAIGFCTLKSVPLSPSSARFVEIVESRLKV
ncbi:MAG TPA: LysR family transcriptional regulator [Thermoclostridium caenicola]|uniref:LysR family transcriptional regulator n=1 Tax=Thermoclostridium caenicola TaxID=659425 RepID=UPI002C8A3070|nr:LysR family transcriptional regulator [Thermoclostridium caenicola]HOL84555.1 LysR family transcriptional regulator [Thermoclostridium caenicola]HPO76299.1 LysR family transcriptional regulator [Thermoclostridium caenicola]